MFPNCLLRNPGSFYIWLGCVQCWRRQMFKKLAYIFCFIFNSCMGLLIFFLLQISAVSGAHTKSILPQLINFLGGTLFNCWGWTRAAREPKNRSVISTLHFLPPPPHTISVHRWQFQHEDFPPKAMTCNIYFVHFPNILKLLYLYLIFNE